MCWHVTKPQPIRVDLITVKSALCFIWAGHMTDPDGCKACLNHVCHKCNAQKMSTKWAKLIRKVAEIKTEHSLLKVV